MTMGDVHHIFPKIFAKERYKRKSKYNQIANYTYLDTQTNISVGDKAPSEYFNIVLNKQKPKI